MWSLWRDPENCLCTQPSLLRSDGVSKGSGKLVLAAIVHMASPQLRGEQKKIKLSLIFWKLSGSRGRRLTPGSVA